MGCNIISKCSSVLCNLQLGMYCYLIPFYSATIVWKYSDMEPVHLDFTGTRWCGGY